MQKENTVFEQTYKYYLRKIRKIPFESIAQKLGAERIEKTLKIPLFGTYYEVSDEKISDPSGEKPSLDICVILSKYLLMCPEQPPMGKEWTSYRDFKDSGPLINYFTKDVEQSIASYFSKNLKGLKKAGRALSGYAPMIEVRYDYSMQFDALPMIPVILLFNDKDEEFPAKCSVLFEQRAEKYLDAECIAMLGWQLHNRLKKSLQ